MVPTFIAQWKGDKGRAALAQQKDLAADDGADYCGYNGLDDFRDYQRGDSGCINSNRDGQSQSEPVTFDEF